MGVTLQGSAGCHINCPLRGNIGNNLPFCPVVNILNISHWVVLDSWLDLVEKDGLATLPLGFSSLNGLVLVGLVSSIPCHTVCNGLALSLVESHLTVAFAHIAIKPTDARFHLTWWHIILCCCCQLKTAPASDAILVSKTILAEAIAAGLINRCLELSIATICFGCRTYIRNGFMPHIMGHKLSHIYAREVRWNFEFDSWYSSKICLCLSKKKLHSLYLFFDNVNFKRWCTSKNFPL